MRIEKSENFTLYLADARDVNIWENGEQADLVVTDPPYPLVAGGNTSGGMSGGWLDEYSNNGCIVECDIEWDEIAHIVFNSMKTGAHAYVMANNRHVENLLRSHREAGLDFHNLLIWHKRSATANRWYMKSCEFTGFFYKKRSKHIKDCSSDMLVSMYQRDETKHPTEKPVPLMRHYIENSTKKGEVVFDPFAGSGSTGVAAIESGRKFIGIERNEKFFEMTLKRLKYAETHIQTELF